MKTESYLRYLLNDNRSLNSYFRQKKKVGLDELKRSILLTVRSKGYWVPDHYYRLGEKYSFKDISEFSDVFTVGLPRLAGEYLEMWGGKVYVKGEMFNDWQLLLPDIPPLILVVSKIWKESGPCVGKLEEFAAKYLLPSVRFTAMPSPYLPAMKEVENKIKGFSDLHIHLNGAVETDLAWHYFLRFPEKVYRDVKKASHNPKVKEQIGQMTDITDPEDFKRLFEIGCELREWLAMRVNGIREAFPEKSFDDLLNEFAGSSQDFRTHPLKNYFEDDTSPLILEGMLYVKVLDFLTAHRQDFVTAGVFHYYLLITGLCNRLLVQQTDAFGFEQFQKYTSNNFRELAEETYGQRFLQLAGNDLSGLRHIEGRFSPKDTAEKDRELIGKIIKGFGQLTVMQEESSIKPSTISLIAHYIKQPDKWKGDVRFRLYREALDARTRALIALKHEADRCGRLLTGVDAAASEFDTPPEVFAPSYRRLKEAGFEHFTYHAGEDFYHVLSGLRAIYEAIIYLGLRQGDRIGHATAAGVDVALWRHNIGARMWMKIEDYLDDLVFAYHMITKYKAKHLEHLLPAIALKCQEYASRIYERTYGMHDLIEAWKLRANDPLDDSDGDGSTAWKLFRYRHSVRGKEKGGSIIEVDTYDIFGEEDLTAMQLLLLSVMHRGQIVIETLPTSNVIIGHHRDYSTYHIYNWYRWGKEGHEVPAIIVGCDDAGIFATNIYNEYCHIYCLLVFEKKLTPFAALDFIRHLVHNAKVYAFT